MKSINTIVYLGHRSRYGLAHLESVLRCETFNVQEIVLPSRERYERFSALLSGHPMRFSYRYRRDYRTATRAIIKRIKELKSECAIRIVFDANQPDEIAPSREHDLLMSCAFPQMFKADLLTACQRGAINFHPSYLPRCRGAHPIYWTIASQEPFGGITCHFMDEKLDSGPIVAQRKIDFDPGRITYAELYDIVVSETPELVKNVEEFFASGGEPCPQSCPGTYFRSDRPIHWKLCFHTTSPDEISAQIRAGRAFAFDRFGRRVEFIPPVAISTSSPIVTNGFSHRLENGTVVDAKAGQVTVKVGTHCVTTDYFIGESTLMQILTRRIARVLHRPVHRDLLTVGDVLR